MLRLFVTSLALAVCVSPASAMNWCGVLQIIPRTPSDFEKLAPLVESATGCLRQATDSAHQATWVCPDDKSTPDKYEGVHISYIRDPGRTIHMILLAQGLTDLDLLRRCAPNDVRDGQRFSSGNVAFRDRVHFGVMGPRLTLASIIPAGMSAIISDTKSYGEDADVESMWQAIFGIKVETSPYTSVKLAGLSPIENGAEAIVRAFENRGSKITGASDKSEILPEWTLSPPTGLAGVNQVVVKGFVRHVHNVDYILSSTADYENFIGLLDAQYGKSKRETVDGCTYRWWQSGNVSIRGEHCPGKSDNLRFYNDVTLDQLDQFIKKLKDDEASGKDPMKPKIDSDML